MTGAKSTFSLHGFSCNFSILLCWSRLYQISWYPSSTFYDFLKLFQNSVTYCVLLLHLISSSFFPILFQNVFLQGYFLSQSLNLILGLQDGCITLLSLPLESYSHPFSLSDSPIEEGAANIYTHLFVPLISIQIVYQNTLTLLWEVCILPIE